MFTMLKPFLKYDATIALSLGLYLVPSLAGSDELINYTILVYFPILLLTAPISFGIWYGYKLFHSYVLSFRKLLKINFVILTINILTYYIPFYESILKEPTRLFDFSPLVLFPTAILIISFGGSIFANQYKNKFPL